MTGQQHNLHNQTFIHQEWSFLNWCEQSKMRKMFLNFKKIQIWQTTSLKAEQKNLFHKIMLPSILKDWFVNIIIIVYSLSEVLWSAKQEKNVIITCTILNFWITIISHVPVFHISLYKSMSKNRSRVTFPKHKFFNLLEFELKSLIF